MNILGIIYTVIVSKKRIKTDMFKKLENQRLVKIWLSFLFYNR